MKHSMFERGDLIRIDCGLFTHPAVFLGGGMLADNSWAAGGSAVRPWREAVGARGWRPERLLADPHAREAFAARAERLAGRRRYSLWTYNCEHFVCEALGVAQNSPQLRDAAGVLVLGLISGLLLTAATGRRSA